MAWSAIIAKFSLVCIPLDVMHASVARYNGSNLEEPVQPTPVDLYPAALTTDPTTLTAILRG
jgi:hypothetical protein